MRFEQERKFYKAFKELSEEWCAAYWDEFGQFAGEIKLDGSFTADQLRAIADLMDAQPPKI